MIGGVTLVSLLVEYVRELDEGVPPAVAAEVLKPGAGDSRES